MENEGIGRPNRSDSRNKWPKNRVNKKGFSTDLSKERSSDSAAKAKTSREIAESDKAKDAVNNFKHSEQQPAPGIRSGRVEDARQKLAEGFYDNPANYWVIVDKIINYLGFK